MENLFQRHFHQLKSPSVDSKHSFFLHSSVAGELDYSRLDCAWSAHLFTAMTGPLWRGCPSTTINELWCESLVVRKLWDLDMTQLQVYSTLWLVTQAVTINLWTEKLAQWVSVTNNIRKKISNSKPTNQLAEKWCSVIWCIPGFQAWFAGIRA